MVKRNYADITDQWGAWITVDVLPGDAHAPQLVQLTITDERTAAVSLTVGQAAALLNALVDAIGIDTKAY